MKEVIQKTCTETVLVTDVDTYNIYAFQGHSSIFKAHRVDGNKYAFVDMDTCEFYANGVHNGLKACIKEALDDDYEVFEFTSGKEFFKWALEVREKEDEEDEMV